MSMGVTSFRQSWFGTLRYCAAKFGYDVSASLGGDAKDWSTGNTHGVLGTAYHSAAEDGNCGNVVSEWKQYITDAVRKQDNPSRVHFGGRFLQPADVTRIAEILCSDASPMEMKIGDIVRSVEQTISDTMVVQGREIKLSYLENGIFVTGIADIFGTARGSDKTILGDYKSSGMWGCIIDAALGDKSSPKAYEWSTEAVAYSPQHLFYRMIGGLSGHPIGNADMFAAILPVNATLVKKGERKGQQRGNPLVIAPASRVSNHVYTMEQKKLIDMHFGGQHPVLPRSFPVEYGKPACPACRWFGACQRNGILSTDTMEVEYD